MLKTLLHKVVSNPDVYNALQYLVGVQYVQKQIQNRLPSVANKKEIFLDLGGGTGINSHLVPSGGTYICLDIDCEKLLKYKSIYPNGSALLSNGTFLPFADGSVDYILFSAVSHHLEYLVLIQLVEETARVLKPSGKFLLLDPLWPPNNPIGSILWKFDRGSFPHTAEELRNIIKMNYVIQFEDRFSVFHQYVLFVSVKENFIEKQ